MKKIMLVATLIFTLILTGCTSAPSPTASLSPLQIRNMTTRNFEGDDKTTFRAVMTVLQDQNYLITNTDSNAGVIVAEKDVDKSASTGEILTVLFVNAHAGRTKGATVKITATLDSVATTETEVRLNAQEVTVKGNTFGDSKGKAISIHDPEVYKSIFDQITVEVERVKARKS